MKKFATFFLALSLSVALAGCGSNKEETEATTTEAATTEEATTEAATTEAATTEETTTEAATAEETEYTGFYVINDDTRVFHRSDCELGGQIPQMSFVISTYNREQLVDEKYYPCEECNP